MRAWRVEKPSASNNLRDEARRYPARTVAIVKEDTASNTSRCGTRVIDDAQPLFQATFVAHVLGQILGATPDDRVIAVRAYERSDDRNTAPLFIQIA
jgi:hypothetical protein